MTPQELRERTWQFSRRTRRFCRPLLHDIETVDAARQLRRAASSAASNYRAACIARTTRNFIAKLDIVLEESDEADFWATDLDDAGLKSRELDWIIDEARQLTRIFAASRRTASGGGGAHSGRQ
jgi:four helix bundle protein